ncbi:MAG: hypothetical protein Q8P67_12215 [archaeon]|nr:hypothetical protein [archaeon]
MTTKVAEINSEIEMLTGHLREITELRSLLGHANRNEREVFFPFSGVYFMMTPDGRRGYEALKRLQEKDLGAQIEDARGRLVSSLQPPSH